MSNDPAAPRQTGLISEPYRHVLRVLHERLQDPGLPWVITGSLGLALHGIELTIDDVDIQTSETGAYTIEDAFRSEVQRKVTWVAGGRIRSHFGELSIGETRVEIMGALQKKLPSGVWEPPVDVTEHRELIDHDGMEIPVLSLEYEEGAYRCLGRVERASQINKWLNSRRDGQVG